MYTRSSFLTIGVDSAQWQSIIFIFIKIFFVNFKNTCELFFSQFCFSSNFKFGHVRICPDLSEKSPTVNKDSRSGSDTRRGLRDLIQYWFWCLPSKYWEIYRCCMSWGLILNPDLSEFVRICPENSDKFGHVRIWNLRKKKTQKKNSQVFFKIYKKYFYKYKKS